MAPVVFLGPSLGPDSASDVLAAEYLPPVARGDVDALLARSCPPEAIAIVDGRFLSSLAISPKEVLRAIDAGITVYGSSSMGALRAVECAPYGMIGIGSVYEAYASGEVDADDEVAIVYDPETLRALSTPLVDLRFALRSGAELGRVSASAARSFLDAAKRLHFPQRTVPNILALLKDDVSPENLGRIDDFLSAAPEAKREDALLLLAAMRDTCGASEAT